MYDGGKLNAWTHVVGAALALGGSIVLITLAVLQGDPWKLLSFSIYSVTLVLLYSASAIYHSLWAQKLDHFCVYLLIAGSYTPFCSGLGRSGRVLAPSGSAGGGRLPVGGQRWRAVHARHFLLR